MSVSSGKVPTARSLSELEQLLKPSKKEDEMNQPLNQAPAAQSAATPEEALDALTGLMRELNAGRTTTNEQILAACAMAKSAAEMAEANDIKLTEHQVAAAAAATASAKAFEDLNAEFKAHKAAAAASAPASKAVEVTKTIGAYCGIFAASYVLTEWVMAVRKNRKEG